MTAAPQVRPAPKTIIKIKSPRWILPEDNGFVQRNGHRGRRRVAVTVQIDEQLFRGGAQAFAHRVNDPAVRLMRE